MAERQPHGVVPGGGGDGRRGARIKLRIGAAPPAAVNDNRPSLAGRLLRLWPLAALLGGLALLGLGLR